MRLARFLYKIGASAVDPDDPEARIRERLSPAERETRRLELAEMFSRAHQQMLREREER